MSQGLTSGEKFGGVTASKVWGKKFILFGSAQRSVRETREHLQTHGAHASLVPLLVLIPALSMRHEFRFPLCSQLL